MSHKLLEFLIRHFHVVRAPAIHKANGFAFDLKNEETIGIDLDPFGYLLKGCCFVAFVGRRLDLKASNCVRGLGVSKYVHVYTLRVID